MKAQDTTDLARDFDDIQAIVGTGFTRLRQGHYLLLQVEDAARARQWIGVLLASGLVRHLGQVRRVHVAGEPPAAATERTPIPESVTLAISHAGLEALGLADHAERPFPSAFRTGMADPSRRALLGDDPAMDWDWGDTGAAGDAVHLLVGHFWAEDAAPAAWLAPQECAAWGLRVHVVPTCPAYIDPPAAEGSGAEPGSREPFGFRDGLSQPVPRGIAWSRAEKRARERAGKALFADRQVALGEFVLGHVNEYREASYCPDVRWAAAEGAAARFAGFGRNGSYMAVRQIQQHVAVFEAFARNCPVPDIAERMMGRRKDGRAMAAESAELDGFRYLAEDAEGFRCPRGAHVRRANPRDALSRSIEDGVAGSRLHRLLRRGRVYTDDTAAPGRECEVGQGEGLMFIALNADIDRQFEFIQREWINGARFGNLRDEQDPILGSAPGRAFSLQGLPVGMRIGDLPRFTTVRGGGYFFVPGLAALRFIANGPPAPSA
ncbi:MAG: peroxidase [Variovorax sp.]|nr:MAG: peroxidase [Variovorax sp.]